MRRELREWGWMALGFSACLFIAGMGVVLWGNHIEHRIDRVVIERRHDHRALRRVTVALGGARVVKAKAEAVHHLESGGSTEGAAPQGQGPSGGTEGGPNPPPAAGPKPHNSPHAEPPTGNQNAAKDNVADSHVESAEAETPATTITSPEVDQGDGQGKGLVKPVFEGVGAAAEQIGAAAEHASCPVSALGARVCTE